MRARDAPLRPTSLACPAVGDRSIRRTGAALDGARWCPHCKGYGSSLKEASDRCTRCGGTGLVAVADPGEQKANGHEPGRLGHAEKG